MTLKHGDDAALLSGNTRDRIIYAAEKLGLKYHVEYELSLDELAWIRLKKCAAYGERRYEATDPEFNRWMCYSDVYRKFIRLEEQMKTGSVEDLLETYRDLANYSIMAVQILGRKS